VLIIYTYNNILFGVMSTPVKYKINIETK
jgi:hypothetical protein